MAPMIDMVFLLLVFFMTVSQMAQARQRVKLDLPESHESEVPKDLSDRTAVSVDEDGNLYWGASPISLEDLKARVETLLADNPELRIQVRADQTTPFREVRKVLVACAEAGAYDVIYATYEAGD